MEFPPDVPLSQRHLQFALALIGDLSWLLWDQQVPIYKAVHSIPDQIDEFVVLCARQFGKSHLGVILAIESATRHRDRCILIMGPDTKQTKDIVNPRMRRIQAYLPPGMLVPSKSENKWILYHDRDKKQLDFSEIVIGGMNENSSSQRGKTVQDIFIEEVEDINPDDYTESLRSDLGPALAHSQAGKMVFLTTPPKVPDHPFNTDTLVKARLNDSLAVFTIDDNTALSPTQYEACVRRCGGKETDDFKREFLCQIIRDKSLVVVPAFNDEKHVLQLTIPPQTTWNIMVDWGGVQDYTVGLLYTYDYLRNKLLFKEEFVFFENTPTNVIWPEIRRWMEDYHIPWTRVYADAPGQVLVDLASLLSKAKERGKMPLVEGEPSIGLPRKDDWESAINNVNVKFGIDFIEIDEGMKFTRETLRSGTFNKKRTDFERTKALGHCDALATLMYAIRHFDKENPYPHIFQRVENVFVRPKTSEASIGAMVGKSFGGRH
jgi:Terminase-like family.